MKTLSKNFSREIQKLQNVYDIAIFFMFLDFQ